MTTRAMRYLRLGLFLAMPLMMVPAAAPAQDRRDRPPRVMRERVEQRFAERVQQALQLSNDQAARLTATTHRYAKRRQELRAREQRLRHALADQLRPGIAADNDSVARLTDDLIGLRLGYAESFRNELKDLSGFLTPVQRARLMIMRERLRHAANRARQGRPRLQGPRARQPGRREP